MKLMRSWLGWLARAAACSVWWPFAGKALAAAVAFAALAHVGSEAALRVAGDGVVATPVKEGLHATHLAVVSPPASPLASPSAPAASASASASASAGCPPQAAPEPAWTEDGRLILNRAKRTDLEKLPRVGAKRAEAIVALREKLGRFRHVRDLMRIRGIGYRMVKQLEPLVVVDPPPPPKK